VREKELAPKMFLPGIAINQPVDQTTAHCSRGLRERERESGDAVEVNPQSLSSLHSKFTFKSN